VCRLRGFARVDLEASHVEIGPIARDDEGAKLELEPATSVVSHDLDVPHPVAEGTARVVVNLELVGRLRAGSHDEALETETSRDVLDEVPTVGKPRVLVVRVMTEPIPNVQVDVAVRCLPRQGDLNAGLEFQASTDGVKALDDLDALARLRAEPRRAQDPEVPAKCRQGAVVPNELIVSQEPAFEHFEGALESPSADQGES